MKKMKLSLSVLVVLLGVFWHHCYADIRFDLGNLDLNKEPEGRSQEGHSNGPSENSSKGENMIRYYPHTQFTFTCLINSARITPVM